MSDKQIDLTHEAARTPEGARRISESTRDFNSKVEAHAQVAIELADRLVECRVAVSVGRLARSDSDALMIILGDYVKARRERMEVECEMSEFEVSGHSEAQRAEIAERWKITARWKDGSINVMVDDTDVDDFVEWCEAWEISAKLL